MKSGVQKGEHSMKKEGKVEDQGLKSSLLTESPLK